MSFTVLNVEIIKKNIYSGHKEIVELLAENGADINAKNIYSNSALVQAAKYGNFQIENDKILYRNLCTETNIHLFRSPGSC